MNWSGRRMKLSIIVPTYNKATRLYIVLKSIQQEVMHLHDPNDTEVIVIDDGSRDETAKIVAQYCEQMQIKYVFQENSGLSAARNTGIRHASYKSLLFLDDDRIVCDGYLQRLSFGDADIVFGRQKEWYIRNLDEWLEQVYKIVTEQKESLHQKTIDSRYYVKTKAIYEKPGTSIPWVGCIFANTLIKREIFEKIGVFSEQFVGWGFEDLDVSYRAFAAGYKIALNSEMITYHLYHQHGNDILKQRDRNYKVFFERNPDYPVQLYENFYHNNISLSEYDEKIRDYYNNQK